MNFARNGTLLVSDTIARQNGGIGIYIDGSPGLPSRASIDHALLESNTFDGLLVLNASVAVRDSVAAANGRRGFWARAATAGTTADLSADNCQATHNDYGFYAGDGSGTARLMVSNSVASANSFGGIRADNNGTVRASNNTVTRNFNGLVQIGTGVFESRGNNSVRGNTSTETSGTITTFAPM